LRDEYCGNCEKRRIDDQNIGEGTSTEAEEDREEGLEVQGATSSDAVNIRTGVSVAIDDECAVLIGVKYKRWLANGMFVTGNLSALNDYQERIAYRLSGDPDELAQLGSQA
jgi:hypothetical protein